MPTCAFWIVLRQASCGGPGSWPWGDRLRVGSKIVKRDPMFISPYIAKIIALGRYEKDERDLLAFMHEHGWIGRGDRVIEAGGGLGAVTMHIADIVGDEAVVAFEPNPRTMEVLRANLALNGYSVAVENAALIAGDRDKVVFFDTIDIGGFLGSKVQADATPGPHSIMVRAEPLVHAISRLDPTVLVMDVEGGEYDLLNSIKNWRRIRAIHLELHPEALTPQQIETMFAHLRKAGFQHQPTPDCGDRVILFARRLGGN